MLKHPAGLAIPCRSPKRLSITRHQTSPNLARFCSDCFGACAGLRPDCTRFAPGLHPGCTRIAPGLHPDCTRVAPGLHPGCTRIAPGLHPDCTRLASGLSCVCCPKTINVLKLVCVFLAKCDEAVVCVCFSVRYYALSCFSVFVCTQLSFASVAHQKCISACCLCVCVLTRALDYVHG